MRTTIWLRSEVIDSLHLSNRERRSFGFILSMLSFTLPGRAPELPDNPEYILAAWKLLARRGRGPQSADRRAMRRVWRKLAPLMRTRSVEVAPGLEVSRVSFPSLELDHVQGALEHGEVI